MFADYCKMQDFSQIAIVKCKNSCDKDYKNLLFFLKYSKF